MLNAVVSDRAVPIDDLLIHAEFVRNLARDLVADPGLADDLAQEAWLQTLQRPPRHGDSLRGWFATLLQNLLHNLRRGERRRRAREHRAAGPRPLPDPAHILEREQVRERLVRAVLDLDEPFRSAVLLRYYEELPTNEIAAQLGVPAATVRTRLARGLSRLRERLDARDGREPGAWLGALTTWIPSPAAAAALPLALSLAMKKTVVAIAAALLLATSLLLVLWRPQEATAPPTSSQSSGVLALTRAEADGHGAPAAPDAARREAAGATLDVREVSVFAADRGTGAVFGTLVDEENRPIADALVMAEPATGTLPPMMQLRDDRTTAPRTRTDANGAFRLEQVAAGPTRLRADLGGTRTASAVAIVSRDLQEGPVVLRAKPAPAGDCLRIRVQDDGAPVADAVVEVFAWSAHDSRLDQPEDARTTPIATGQTDADGECVLRGRALRSGFAFARRGDRVGQVYFDVDAGSDFREVTLDVHLTAGARVAGHLTGAGRAALAGAVISLHTMNGATLWGGSRRYDTAVRDDAFVFEGLPPGHYGFSLHAPQGARIESKPFGSGRDVEANSARMTTVDLVAGANPDVELQTFLGPRLLGHVSCAGSPVAGARVRAVLAPRSSNYSQGFVLRGAHVWRLDRSWENCPNDPINHVETTTDASGNYDLCGLQPGVHRVEVYANGLNYDRRMAVPLEDGATVRLDHELEPAGVLQLAALDLNYVGVIAAGSDEPEMIAIVNREHVTFPGLRPGLWQIARIHSDSRIAPVVFATAQVTAGRTTWLDLRKQSVQAVIQGQVTSGGVPRPGIAVGLGSHWVRTDDFGAFRIENGYQVTLSPMRSQLRIESGGVSFAWSTGDQEARTSIEASVELGTRTIDVAVSDADGRPTHAKLELYAPRPQPLGSPILDVNCDLEVPVGGVRLGPLPNCSLLGWVTFDGGYRHRVELDEHATTLLVRQLPTASLRVDVRRDGAPQSRVWVAAMRWSGAGAAPNDEKDFRDSCEPYQLQTDDTGRAEFAVPTGEYMVCASSSWLRSPPVWVRVERGEPARVELALPGK